MTYLILALPVLLIAYALVQPPVETELAKERRKYAALRAAEYKASTAVIESPLGRYIGSTRS